jgi:hypothetical protein
MDKSSLSSLYNSCEQVQMYQEEVIVYSGLFILFPRLPSSCSCQKICALRNIALSLSQNISEEKIYTIMNKM